MKIIIETPKYSFFKYHRIGKEFKKVFFSPIPTIFNYGFIEGTKGLDGMEEDAVVLGPRLDQGCVIERDRVDGVVRFVDDGVRDDKQLIHLSGTCSIPVLSIYFRMYTFYKILLYLVLEGRVARCRFEGIEMLVLTS
ncbi:MAG: inorganic diphosphatase [Methanosarcinaceae archaeon]|nr:inorganic diphosphatase [Methanosarcinaceae archaeon]